VRAGNVPQEDSAVVERLKRAGAIIIGKTVTHEFAFGDVSPPTRNPWNLGRIPGGSSGGSAAAVAADMCLGAIGTDTGGSVRTPAAMTGVTGLKPTFGLISRYGVTPLAWTLDTVGPITKNVNDAGILFEAMAGFDPRDKASVKRPEAGASDKRSAIRLGVPTNYFFDRLDPEVSDAVHAAIDVFRKLGAEVHEVKIPFLEHALTVGLTITLAEASAYHEKDLRRSPALIQDDVRTLLELGEIIPSRYYIKAQRVRGLIRQPWPRPWSASTSSRHRP